MIEQTIISLSELMKRVGNQMDGYLTYEQIAQITTKILRNDCGLQDSIRYDGNGLFILTEIHDD